MPQQPCPTSGRFREQGRGMRNGTAGPCSAADPNSTPLRGRNFSLPVPGPARPAGLQRETANGGFKQMPVLCSKGPSKTREALEKTKDPSTGAETHISNKTEEKSQFLSSEM